MLILYLSGPPRPFPETPFLENLDQVQNVCKTGVVWGKIFPSTPSPIIKSEVSTQEPKSYWFFKYDLAS